MRFSDKKLNALRRDTSSDRELSALREIICSGWPEKQKQVSVPLRKYWAYGDELFIENALIIKGERVITPESLRDDILEKINQAHQGVAKCQIQAKPVYFGLILTRTLKLKCRSVKSVKKGKTHKPTKQWNHMKFLLDHTWQVVGTDLFTWNGDEYLLMWDYYSKFPSSDLENTKWTDHWTNSCKA